jgi:hypothetical protein
MSNRYYTHWVLVKLVVWRLPLVKLGEKLAEVDGKPYNLSELLIQGRLKGYVKISKHVGISGEVLVDSNKTIYEHSGILVVGNCTKSTGPRIEVREGRRGLLVKTPSKTYDVYELGLNIEDAEVSLAVSFTPRRLVAVILKGLVSFREKFMSLDISIKSHKQAEEATGAELLAE